MQLSSYRIRVVLFGAVAIAALALLFYVLNKEEPPAPVVETEEAPIEEAPPFYHTEIIGSSVEGREIVAHSFGNGPTHLLFVGGIHGGYEWNSVLLSYELIDYLDTIEEAMPDSLTISVIPALNPDGVYAVVGKEGRFTRADVPEDEGPLGTGRFNANGVDLNRNFDCKWAPESNWRGEVVSAGSEPFSEPEAAALRDFVIATEPKAVIFYHSQANAVYASECKGGVLPETLAIMDAYGDAAGYRTVPKFDAYPITGDAEGWLASRNIPALSVELATHESVEWDKNMAGIQALFEYYTLRD